MRSILVGMDGTVESRAALRWSAKLARNEGARLRLVGVAWAPNAYVIPELAADAAEIEAYERARLAHVLRGAVMDRACAGLDVEVSVESGPPADTLARLAREEDVDRVVVGQRNRSKIDRLLFGSVSQRLPGVCEKPVSVVAK
jgi:nucleotide-binding universal stress UspA family protein